MAVRTTETDHGYPMLKIHPFSLYMSIHYSRWSTWSWKWIRASLICKKSYKVDCSSSLLNFFLRCVLTFFVYFFLSQWNNLNQQKPFYGCSGFKNRKEPQTQQERIHKQAVNKESLKACIPHKRCEPLYTGAGPGFWEWVLKILKVEEKKIGSLPNDHKTQRYMYWNDNKVARGYISNI
jgi:hypothetical protein